MQLATKQNNNQPMAYASSEQVAPHSWLSRALAAPLRDPRDTPLMVAILKAAMLLVPMGLYLLLGEVTLVGAAAYWAIMIVVCMESWTLMLHNVTHRRIFTDRWRWLEKAVHWIIGPFLGHPPQTYPAHHLYMHHRENNGPKDLSSTEKYQRDSLTGFLSYFFCFIGTIVVALPRYLFTNGKRPVGWRALSGELYFYALTTGVLLWRPYAGLVVFVVPFVVMRFAMMAGNWAQHAFIAQESPDDPYLNSTTCMEPKWNTRAFNDGFHVEHHIKPGRHWTKAPEDFAATRSTYRQKGAIVFCSLSFIEVWFLLMLHRYRTLAKDTLDYKEGTRTLDETIALLRRRTKPIQRQAVA